MYPTIATRQEIQKWGIKKYASDETARGLFRHPEDFFNRLDTIVGTQAGWQEGEVKDHKGMYICKCWMRNPLAVLQEIMENCGLKELMVWAPVKMYDQAGNRVYTDLHTSD